MVTEHGKLKKYQGLTEELERMCKVLGGGNTGLCGNPKLGEWL